eukprot:TRINITY_DN62841_c0_g1_i1.p3 TRINITY_DN62841_c0_g1~~TRINITY_DN62841_c0_g1_i1.p3  ORF type:complete len:144 (+),score=51.71 TRINITY_DN62841_c0_g1_i1:83-514(+)
MPHSAADAAADAAVISALELYEEAEAAQRELNGLVKDAHLALVAARRHAEDTEFRDLAAYEVPDDAEASVLVAEGERGVLEVRAAESSAHLRWFTSASTPPPPLCLAQQAWQAVVRAGCRAAAARARLDAAAQEAGRLRAECP